MSKSKADTLGYLQKKWLGPADELRERLSQLEEADAAIKLMDSTQALNLLQNLDWIAQRFEELEAGGMDLRPERGRFQTVKGQIEKKPSVLLRAIGGPTALVQHRSAPAPPRENSWWYLDEIAEVQQKKTLRRYGIILAVIVVIIGALVLLFNTVLKPSPEAIARLNAQNDANFAIDEGDFELALTILEDGLNKVPEDPSLLILKGVVQQELGDEAAAAEIFAQVQEMLDDPTALYLMRARLYLRMNQPEKATQEIEVALDLDEENAMAWLLLGQALVVQGHYYDALQSYEIASDIAFETDENEVYVLSKMALGQLRQSPPPLVGTDESQTPIPTEEGNTD
jgi:tetratricopeptide (TPR) repeat protein